MTLERLQASRFIEKEYSWYSTVVPEGWEVNKQRDDSSLRYDRYMDRYAALTIILTYSQRPTSANLGQNDFDFNDLDDLEEAQYPTWKLDAHRSGVIAQLQPIPSETVSVEKTRYENGNGLLVTRLTTDLSALIFLDGIRFMTSPKIHIMLSINGDRADHELKRWRQFFTASVVCRTHLKQSRLGRSV